MALLFLFFHKRLCGPLANSRFHHRPDPQHRPNSRLEAAYHRADAAIQRVVDLVPPLEFSALPLHDCPTRFVKLRSGKNCKPPALPGNTTLSPAVRFEARRLRQNSGRLHSGFILGPTTENYLRSG